MNNINVFGIQDDCLPSHILFKILSSHYSLSLNKLAMTEVAVLMLNLTTTRVSGQ
jgi:hypothetical protein